MRSSCKTAFAVEWVMLCGGRRMCSYESRRGLEVGRSYFWRSVGVTSSSCSVLLVWRTVASRSAISSGVCPCKREGRVADVAMVLPQSSKDG
eukprot:6368014-Ditylum_brightwellii.AAC.1